MNSNDRCEASALVSLAALKRFLSAGWLPDRMLRSGRQRTTIRKGVPPWTGCRFGWPAAGPKLAWRLFAAVLMVCFQPAYGWAQDSPEAEFQSVTGKHITLVSDSEDQQELKQLVASFDAAVPQWAERLNRSQPLIADFHIKAYLMEQADRFRRSGDLPSTLNFKFGFARNQTVWLFKQPSEYYTRHLLLHEGVHAFCLDQFNGIGPQWFGEGVAEWLAGSTPLGILRPIVPRGVSPPRTARPRAPWSRPKPRPRSPTSSGTTRPSRRTSPATLIRASSS